MFKNRPGQLSSSYAMIADRLLELYVEAGIPAPDVLRLATLGAARLTGRDDCQERSDL